MPLPNPRTGETQSQFVSRCAGNEVMVNEFPNMNQRLAVCYGQWRRSHEDIDEKERQQRLAGLKKR